MVGYRQGEDWCMTTNERLDVYEKNLRLNKVPFQRCPKCKRRLQLKVLMENGENVTYIPAHKIRKTKRK